jgi:hypothetical protein
MILPVESKKLISLSTFLMIDLGLVRILFYSSKASRSFTPIISLPGVCLMTVLSSGGVTVSSSGGVMIVSLGLMISVFLGLLGLEGTIIFSW